MDNELKLHFDQIIVVRRKLLVNNPTFFFNDIVD